MPVVVDHFEHRHATADGHEHTHVHGHAHGHTHDHTPPGRAVIAELLRPFEFEFFRNGLLVATMAGALCGLVGVYVVLKGMSYIGHGLSHAIFGGFAASTLLGINFLLGAGRLGRRVGAHDQRRHAPARARLGCGDRRHHDRVVRARARAVRVLRRRGRQLRRRAVRQHPRRGTQDVVAIAVVCALASSLVFLRYRALLFTTFDPEVAEVSGVNTARMDALLMLVLAGSILATMKVLGVTLIAAALVIPPAVARMLTTLVQPHAVDVVRRSAPRAASSG